MSTKLWVVVPAAGIGVRMNTAKPKQYLPLLGRTILQHTVAKLLRLPIERLVLALHADDKHFKHITWSDEAWQKLMPVDGGRDRCRSVYQALSALSQTAADDDWVLVHDAVRPCVTDESLQSLLAAFEKRERHVDGILLAVPVKDTLKKVSADSVNQALIVNNTMNRDQLWHAQTPQVFKYAQLLNALTEVVEQGSSVTDEAMAMERQGHILGICPGREDNIKITTQVDLHLAEFILRQQGEQ